LIPIKNNGQLIIILYQTVPRLMIAFVGDGSQTCPYTFAPAVVTAEGARTIALLYILFDP